MNTLTPIANEMIVPERWRPIMDAYLRTLDSSRTQHAYRKAIEHAFQTLGDLDTLSAIALTNYRETWMKRLDDSHAQPLAPSSVAQHLAALRAFLKFARLTDQLHLSVEVIRFTLKSPRVQVIRPYQVLTDKEFGRLIAAARGNLRDRMIFTIADATGLREAELCRLKVGDLTLDEEQDIIVRVRSGKGRKDRLVPLDRNTASLTLAYLKTRNLVLGDKSALGEYLFVSRKGQGHGKLSTARLRQLMAFYLKKAHITKNVSMHSLRHGAAVRWVKRTKDVNAARKLLGHSSLETTQKYLDHENMRNLKETVNA